jgi:hypothetical protein
MAWLAWVKTPPKDRRRVPARPRRCFAPR